MLIDGYILTAIWLFMSYRELAWMPEDYSILYFLGCAFYFEHVGAY